MKNVFTAMTFAIGQHEGQRRKYTNEPYWKHLAEVAAITQSAPDCTLNMIRAAWLHDTLEDTNTTPEQIRTMFGARVLEIVDALTDVSRPEDGNRATRKALDREHIAQAGYEAQTVKLADLISNTSSIVDHDTAFARIYLREKEQLLAVLTKGDPALLMLARQTLEDGWKQLDDRTP
ncbi:MAG: metal dependent phosphohydrolase [Marinobacter sp. T13-3]|nr:MAG: metal dependent phosphohydrolase [Marinobacter sp. T13-3]